jgi:hypothetical protein
MRQERAVDWFEVQVQSSWERLAGMAAESKSNVFAYALLEWTTRLMVKAVEQQEAVMLDRLCRVLEKFVEYIEPLPAVTNTVNAALRVQHAMEMSFGLEATDVVMKTSNYSPSSVRNLHLPAITTEIMTDMDRKLQAESRVIGKRITPPAQANREVQEELKIKAVKLQSDFGQRLVSLLAKLARAARQAGRFDAVLGSMASMALLAQRQLQRVDMRAASEAVSALEPWLEVLRDTDAGAPDAIAGALEHIQVLVAKAFNRLLIAGASAATASI